MKNNLNTFPNYFDIKERDYFRRLQEYREQVLQWRLDFEKELQRKLVHPTNTKSIAVYDFIKEILGDG